MNRFDIGRCHCVDPHDFLSRFGSLFKENLNASKPSEHPPQVEECLKV